MSEALRKHPIARPRSDPEAPSSTSGSELAALDAYTAAADAFVSVGYNNEAFVGAALRDYDMLVRLQLGQYPCQRNQSFR